MQQLMKEFREFAVRGRVTDMAIGIIIGAAFTLLVNSVVHDLFAPLLGLFGDFTDLNNYFVVLTEGEPTAPYASLEAARSAGAATFNYGAFLSNLLHFLIVAVALFLVVRLINRLRRELEVESTPVAAPAATRECPHCRSAVHPEATRCPSCTSVL